MLHLFGSNVSWHMTSVHVPQIYTSVCNSACNIAPFLEDDDSVSDLQPALLQMPNILNTMPEKLQRGLKVLARGPCIFTLCATH